MKKSVSKFLSVTLFFLTFSVVNTLNVVNPKVYGSNLNSSSNATKKLVDEVNEVFKLEKVSGELLSEEEALKVLKKTMDTMKNLESFEGDGETIDYIGNEKKEGTYTLIYNIKKEEHKTENSDGKNYYTRDGKYYFQENGEWVAINTTKGYSFIDGHDFNEKSIDKLNVYKVDDHFVIESKKEMTPIEKYNLFVIKDENIKEPEYNKYIYLFQHKVDKDGKIIEIYQKRKTKEKNKIDAQIVKMKLKNFNNAEEIVFPKELDNAKLKDNN